ncbi:hypothetical protein CRM90_29905 [Mycobacterium sp. ENV421]|uniref:hypothetical protein n=1 Tax=Mycobacterium sp. ENV421 TaxID=1213407 RepID=UPI000C9CD7CB|nr:hypothetical protein [Mycobacterium sp. ENV421]PND54105.1 hypothetical protein CRM90_29905 [Mycobacterium sp. ENV421]
MVTVEADLVCVESRLAAGQIRCPVCSQGVLGGWGFARIRRVVGLITPVRPRRARCRSCLVTHVLSPATVLLRRAYAAEQIWMSLAARAQGVGHRRIAARLNIPATTVRGWLRRAGGRLEAIRVWFLQVAVQTGIDVAIPDGVGCGWGDVVAAVEAAVAAVGQRFGPAGLVGAVTPALVMVAVTGGRLLAPDWPTTR